MAGRRGRSGPPGNQNARRHGLYARALTAAQAVRLRAARRLPEDLREEIALLRAKVAQLLDAEPDNMAALVDGLRVMTAMVLAQRKLTGARDDPHALESAIRGILGELAPLFPGDAHAT
jgi:hypothetical protein